MNILLINHYAGSPNYGMEFRPYYMSKEWVSQGHKVLIIGGSFSHLRKEQPQVFREEIDGIQYCWIKLNEYAGNGLGRIFSMFSFVSKLCLKFNSYLNGFGPDVVIASSTYPLDIYPAHKIAKKYKAKLIYEVHDLWPLSPMEIGGYSKYHPFIMIMQRAENYAYKFSDKVVSLLPNALEHMMEHGLKEDKFIYIPNGFDLREWEKPEKLSYSHNEFLNNLHEKGFYILGYVGGHAKSNALDYLLDAMKLIQNKRIICVLVGKGHEKMRLQQRAKVENITNVYFLEPVSKREVPSLLSLMDALYIGWENNPLYRFGISPNKLIDYMMSKKVIVHSVSAANDWVQEVGCGISIEAENSVAISKAIDELFTWDSEKCLEKGQRGQMFVQEKLSYSYLSRKFIDCVAG
ncbi:glycosyltransferase family 4 protein [Bacteroides thetaiotaomicron]|uniref:glycosyltransferase family 4 protein n=1 Tax=Bacteroides thetaiotaomicron TaxID=818 RepID=UPI0010441AFE|nr:glycosyltransferase family 4 protein [Bacteroides thetaiotaomicron]